MVEEGVVGIEQGAGARAGAALRKWPADVNRPFNCLAAILVVTLQALRFEFSNCPRTND